jgi:adenylate cyclase
VTAVTGSLEIERKFLVSRRPADLERHPHSNLDQGYVALDPAGVEVRIRRQDGEATLTIKGGRGRSRTEEEVAIDPERFERMWALTERRRVAKTRYRIAAGAGLTIELDVYHGPLDGLLTAEVEFGSEAQADAFTAPNWFGREVTGVDAYNNRRLAVDGRPADT